MLFRADVVPAVAMALHMWWWHPIHRWAKVTCGHVLGWVVGLSWCLTGYLFLAGEYQSVERKVLGPQLKPTVVWVLKNSI